MNPAFWQYLLAGRLSPQLTAHLVEEIGSHGGEPISSLLSHPALSPAARNRIKKANLRALDAAIASGVQVLTAHDYPSTLEEADGMPPALFVRGDLAALQAPMVGIVGTRNAGSYGLAVAEKYAYVLAGAGVTIVSGGAYGIDTAAHRGALAAGGRTVCVFGTGIDHPHPVENKPLFKEILQRGLLVSQFACGERGDRASLLQRNGVIAGLSHALLAVEVPGKSGALTTARAASDFGREVFVIPGLVTMPKFKGSHYLIREGATLVDHPEQVLDALDTYLPLRPPTAEESDEAYGNASRILEVLREGPTSLEALKDRTELEITELMEELTVLEMEGMILRDANGYSVRP